MSFHNPTALLWMTLAIPIVIVHLLKTRRRQVPVSTLLFWQEIFEESQPRRIWLQLRHWFSLLLQLIVLSLLTVALADPYFSSELQQTRRIVVVLDNSASMQAASGTPSRFEIATDRLMRLIRSLRRGDEMAIVTAGSSANVLSGLTDQKRTLQHAVEQASVTDGPTRLTAALAIAQRLRTDHDNGRVVVFTDVEQPGTLDESTGTVEWIQLGAAARNVAITKFQVRRSMADPIGFQTLIEVSSFSDEPVTSELRLQLDDTLLDVIPLTFPPGESRSLVFDNTSVAGGVLSATISSDDALPVDNQAQAMLSPTQRLPVTLVTDGNWFLQQVLESHELVDLAVTSQVPPVAPDEGLLVLHRSATTTLPGGNVLVIQPTSSTELWQLDGAIDQPLVAVQEDASPLMQHVQLQNVLLPTAPRLIPISDSDPLVETADGTPLYIRFPRSSGDVLVLAVDLDQTDLPLRTAFPILMTNALAWFSGQHGELIESVSTGDVFEIPLPERLRSTAAATAGRLLLIDPDGLTQNVTATGGSVTIGPLSKTGVWTLQGEANDADRLLMACNLTDRSESDLREASPDVALAPQWSSGSAGRPLWFYLVLLTCGLVVVEWFLFHRRSIA